MVFMNWFKKKPVRVYEAPARKRPPTAQESAMTVKADPKRLTPAIEADIREQITSLPDIPENERAFVIEQAVESIRSGGNLHRLCWALNEAGVEPIRAKYLAHNIDRKIETYIKIERYISLGIVKATWRYSGAPCFLVTENNEYDYSIDDPHKEAHGKEYDVRRGLKIAGEFTHPGIKWACKCVPKPIIPGFDD